MGGGKLARRSIHTRYQRPSGSWYRGGKRLEAISRSAQRTQPLERTEAAARIDKLVIEVHVRIHGYYGPEVRRARCCHLEGSGSPVQHAPGTYSAVTPRLARRPLYDLGTVGSLARVELLPKRPFGATDATKVHQQRDIAALREISVGLKEMRAESDVSLR